MIRSQQWCIQQMPEGGYRLSRVLRHHKGAVVFGDVIETETIKDVCKGSLHFTFMPEEYHLFTDKFPQLKPELLDLQIKKRFSDMGLAVDPASLIHTTRAIEGRNGYHNSIFLPESDLTQNLSQLSATTGVSSCNLIPTAASVAGLIKTVTGKAVLVLLIGIRFSHVLVVKNGVPLYSQSLAQTGPGEVEQALIPNAIDFARITAKKEFDIDSFEILALGPGRDTLKLEELEIVQWQPDFSAKIQTAQPDAVLYYPNLFGALFAERQYNFLPKEFSKTWQLQRVSKIVAACSAFAGVILLAGWLYYQPQLNHKQTRYTSLTAELAEQRRHIADKIPAEEQLDNFERLLAIRSNAIKEFRLDSLANLLAQALPPKVHVTDLTMRRQESGDEENRGLPEDDVPPPGDPLETGSAGTLSVPEKLQSRPFTMSLTCSSEGSYEDVTTRFKTAATALNKMFVVENFTWNYREAENTGTIHCNLKPVQEVE